MRVGEILKNGFLLGIAGIIAASGGLVSTVLGSRRARDEERVACEDKLRAIRSEAGLLSDELYQMKTRRQETR
jgi:hypothetical protein